MILTDDERELLSGMLLHYLNRVKQAKMAAMRPTANPLFKKQMERDKARADLIGKILKAEEADRSWGPG